MPPTDDERDLEAALEAALGRRPARTLMGRLVPESEEPARRSDLADLKADLGERIDALGLAVDARLDGMDAKLAAMDMKIDTKIDALDVKFEGRLQSLFARTVAANLVIMIALAGLVLAAAGVR